MTVGKGREKAGQREIYDGPALSCLIPCKAVIQFFITFTCGVPHDILFGGNGRGSAHGTEV